MSNSKAVVVLLFLGVVLLTQVSASADLNQKKGQRSPAVNFREKDNENEASDSSSYEYGSFSIRNNSNANSNSRLPSNSNQNIARGISGGGAYGQGNFINRDIQATQQGSIVFPGPNPDTISISKRRPQSQFGAEKRQIPPLRVLQKLSNETDFGKIVKEFVINAKIHGNSTGEQILVDNEGQPILDSRGKKIIVPHGNNSPPGPGRSTSITTLGFPGANQTNFTTKHNILVNPRHGGVKPPVDYTFAVCRPEEQTVEVPVAFDPSIIYHPTCVRVDRCGGCCGSNIIACEPVETTTVDVVVTQYAYAGEGNKLILLKTDYIPVEKHTRCQCGCRTKENDCGPRQLYRKNECMCVCANVDEKSECDQSELKVWDSTNCSCDCVEIKDCNSGSFFDLNTCRCVPTPTLTRRRGRRNNRKNISRK